jgi:hypothetical protein
MKQNRIGILLASIAAMFPLSVVAAAEPAVGVLSRPVASAVPLLVCQDGSLLDIPSGDCFIPRTSFFQGNAEVSQPITPEAYTAIACPGATIISLHPGMDLDNKSSMVVALAILIEMPPGGCKKN